MPRVNVPRGFGRPLRALIEIHGRAAGRSAATSVVDAFRPEIGNVGLALIAAKVGSRSIIAVQRSHRGVFDRSFLTSASSATLAMAAFTCRSGSIFFAFIQCDKYSATLYAASVGLSSISDQIVGEFTFVGSVLG